MMNWNKPLTHSELDNLLDKVFDDLRKQGFSLSEGFQSDLKEKITEQLANSDVELTRANLAANPKLICEELSKICMAAILDYEKEGENPAFRSEAAAFRKKLSATASPEYSTVLDTIVDDAGNTLARLAIGVTRLKNTMGGAPSGRSQFSISEMEASGFENAFENTLELMKQLTSSAPRNTPYGN